jgi:hypothetical protein
MITPLYRDKNNLLSHQLNFKFSATRISPDVTTILMPVRHLDESRQCPFPIRYFFNLEDPHKTIHDLHFRQGIFVSSCTIIHTMIYIYTPTNYHAINTYMPPNLAPSLINISLNPDHSQNTLITTLVDHICHYSFYPHNWTLSFNHNKSKILHPTFNT